MTLEGFLPHSQAAELELRPARFSDRFIAYVIDVAPFAAGYGMTLWAAAAGRLPDAPWLTGRNVLVGWAGACLLYQWAGNLAGGQIGKRIMGLRVVARDGGSPGFVAGLVRALGYALSTPFFSLGFLVALVHPESRALDDLLSGTLVVESRPKPEAASGALFLCAVAVLFGLYALAIGSSMNRPTPDDRQALAQARQGLFVLAAVEEDYKARNGSYTQSLPDLAQASGNPAVFQSAMLSLFMPDGFQMTAGGRGYRLSAKAKDRRRTRLTLEGPPPQVSAR